VGVRILIVEDEQIIAADLRNQLRRMGHEVIGIAVSGQEAIEIAETAKPELVLMDVQLDGKMSGTEAARIIQERAGSRVIFLTAFPGVFLRDPSQMMEPGICLGKPFSRPQLEAALGAALGDAGASHIGRVH
jgi:two-component system, cell cycle sensor histidine kinase and response regulator CckA